MQIPKKMFYLNTKEISIHLTCVVLLHYIVKTDNLYVKFIYKKI